MQRCLLALLFAELHVLPLSLEEFGPALLQDCRAVVNIASIIAVLIAVLLPICLIHVSLPTPFPIPAPDCALIFGGCAPRRRKLPAQTLVFCMCIVYKTSICISGVSIVDGSVLRSCHPRLRISLCAKPILLLLHLSPHALNELFATRLFSIPRCLGSKCLSCCGLCAPVAKLRREFVCVNCLLAAQPGIIEDIVTTRDFRLHLL
mmetsp:Transcript_22785/g.37756  ORF Transcript_22785/g.37756 Transcript_22785/m.37756 type:complete len:205 (-) Transcript_22785:689-1303(-)